MKKLTSILMMGVAIVALWGCKEDTYPRLDKDPATLTLTLNTPPMANQFFYLSDGTTETFDLSCSQPDYGFSAIARYAVMVSLSDKFEHNSKYVHEGEDEYFPRPGDFVELRDPGTLAYMQVKQLYLTRAICKLLTYTNDEGQECQIEEAADLTKAMAEHYPDGYLPVYLKVHCYLQQAPEASSVISDNYVCLSRVIPSFSLEVPALIYMTGEFNDFPTPEPANVPSIEEPGYPQVAGKLWALSEQADQIDSKLFYASFYLVPMADKDEQFRFYQIPPADGWGATGSLGGSEADFSSADLKLKEGKGSAPVVEDGQGNFNLIQDNGSEIEEGWYDFEVDLNNKKLTVRKVNTPSYETTYQP